MHKSGQIPLEKMSKVYALKDFQEAINDMKSGAVSTLLFSLFSVGREADGLI